MVTKEHLEEIERALDAPLQQQGPLPPGFVDIGPRDAPGPGQPQVLDYFYEAFRRHQPRENDVASNVADTRLAHKFAWLVESTLDQDVDLQVYGAFTEEAAESRQFDIGVGVTLSRTDGSVAIPVNLELGWFPWIGIRATPVLPLTDGQIGFQCHVQKYYNSPRMH